MIPTSVIHSDTILIPMDMPDSTWPSTDALAVAVHGVSTGTDCAAEKKPVESVTPTDPNAVLT